MENYLTEITNYLLTQSWQIAILVAVIATINLTLKNKSAHVRYLLWLIVLAKCLVPPLLTVPVAVLPERGPTAVFEPVAAHPVEPAVAPAAPVAVAPEVIAVRETRKLTPRQWLGLGWLAGVGVFVLVAVAKALRTVFWLRRQRRPLPAELQRQVENVFSDLTLKRFPKLWLIDGTGQPFVWGLLRGSIYLPADFAKVDNAEHRRGVLGHELSHILRFDAAVNLLQIIVQAIFWFHPFVWWANKKIRAEREKCCDEMAIARLGAKAKDYSTAIVNILVCEYESTRPVPSLAVAGPVKNIEERIKTIMRPGKRFYKRPSLRAVIVLLLVALLTVPIGCALIRRARTETATERAEKRYASLYEAAKAGDLAEVKRLIAEGADLNAFDKEDKMTPLGTATNQRHTEIVKLLLDSGANVNIADSYYSPLYYAIWNNDNDTIKALIAGGADVNLTPEHDDTPLTYAIWQWQTDIVRSLLDAGANTEQEETSGMSPLQNAIDMGIPDMVKLLINTDDNVPDLHKAALKGDISKLQELLKEGANINDKDKFSRTPIEYALAGGQSDTARFLLNQGADINITSRRWKRWNRTLLPETARAGLIDIVRILIEGGLPVSGMGPNALHQAVHGGHIDVVKLLIEKGADVNVKNSSGLTPLDIAKQNRQPEIVELLKQNGAKESPLSLTEIVRSNNIEELNRLISQGADMNETSANGGTLLHIVAQTGNKDIAELLINNGADVNAKNRINVTPMHVSIENGNKDIVELLISKGADLTTTRTTRGRRGSTALHDAVDVARKDIVELLVAGGSDVNARTDLGITPLYIAEQNGYTEIVGLLLKHGAKEISPSLFGAFAYGDIEQIQALLSQGADINAKNNSGQTLLHLACRTGNKEVAELLIDKGADINAKTNSGRTPLNYAVQFGHKDIVELLIAKGADVNAENKAGRTVLDMAEEKGDTRIVEILQKHGAKKGSPTLVQAVTSGNIEQVKSLISKGADINANNERGQTPLLLALNSNRMEVAELLVVNGADVEATDDQTGKALLLSVGGRKERVEFLLSKGANIEAKGGNGLTLLQLMAAYSNQKDYLDVVKLLLEKGADIETRGYGDCTPIQTVAEAGRKEAAELLLAHGANINAAASKFFGTTVDQAMRGGHRDMVRWCLSKGASLPSLHQAAYFGETEKIRSLLNGGADINQEDIAKFTALHCAVFAKNKETAKLLIDSGADVTADSACHSTLLCWACETGDLDIIKLLVDNGAKVKGRAFGGLMWGPMLMDNWSNLHEVAHMGHVDVVEYLLAKGADIDAKCTRGDGDLTPLHFAARKGHVNVVKVLLAKGADANLRSKEGHSPLDLARQENHKDVVELLRKHGAKE